MSPDQPSYPNQPPHTLAPSHSLGRNGRVPTKCTHRLAEEHRHAHDAADTGGTTTGGRQQQDQSSIRSSSGSNIGSQLLQSWRKPPPKGLTPPHPFGGGRAGNVDRNEPPTSPTHPYGVRWRSCSGMPYPAIAAHGHRSEVAHNHNAMPPPAAQPLPAAPDQPSLAIPDSQNQNHTSLCWLCSYTQPAL